MKLRYLKKTSTRMVERKKRKIYKRNEENTGGDVQKIKVMF